MRKRILVLLCAVLMLSGCSDLNNQNNDNIDDNPTNGTNITENSAPSVKINSDAGVLIELDGIQGLYDGNLIYTKPSSDEFNSEDGGSVFIDFCKYNIGTGESKELGTSIASYSSGDVGYLNEKLYVYESGSVYEDSASEWKSATYLLEIGLADDSYTVISEIVDTNVVRYGVCGEYVISLKESQDGVLYIDRLNTTVENSQYEPIIMFSSEPEDDVTFKNFSFYENNIYVLVSNSVDEYSIGVYDLNGVLLKSIVLPEKIGKSIESSVSWMQVFGDYIMISSKSTDVGFVIDIESESLDIVLETSNIRASISSKTTDDIYLFSTSSGTVWKYDREVDKIEELDGRFDGITYMHVCDDDILVHANSNVYYFLDGSFLVEK